MVRSRRVRSRRGRKSQRSIISASLTAHVDEEIKVGGIVSRCNNCQDPLVCKRLHGSDIRGGPLGVGVDRGAADREKWLPREARVARCEAARDNVSAHLVGIVKCFEDCGG